MNRLNFGLLNVRVKQTFSLLTLGLALGQVCRVVLLVTLVCAAVQLREVARFHWAVLVQLLSVLFERGN